MEMALAFNNVQLVPVLHNNQPWIRATELARALGYKDESSVRRIYERNSDEFSPDMTQVIEITETVNLTAPASGGNSDDGNGHIPGLRIMARIFSLRGCHLLAMFARTPVAKSFRRWVLDVLDKLAEQERARLAEPVRISDRLTSTDSLSTAASRKPLRALVHAWAQISGTPHTALWPQVKAHFQLSRIDDLPESWIPDALEWVQAKIDQCGKALPPSPGSVSDESRLPIYRNGYFYPPHKNRKHVAGPREKALRDFWDTEYHMRVAELEKKFREMMDAINAATKDGLYAQAISNIGKDADTMFSVDSLLQGMYTPESMAHAAFKEAMELACLHMRMATSIATALNM